MMSSNINEIDNGVNETGIIFDEGFLPGRVTCVGEQAVLGRQPTTVHDKIVKRKWSKANYKVAMECFLRAQKGGRGVGKRTLDLWLDRGMFDISENNLMNQIRVIKNYYYYYYYYYYYCYCVFQFLCVSIRGQDQTMVLRL